MAVGPKETEEKILRRRKTGQKVGSVLRWVGRTGRYWYSDPHDVIRSLPHPHIYAVWHNRLALTPMWYRRMLPPEARLVCLISASGDGETLVSAMDVFRIEAARGSRSRGGSEAMRTMLQRLKEGCDIGFTPDGPRGPRYEVQPGVASLARLSGAPIVPVCFNVSWKYKLKSWDKFQVPLPFTKFILHIREPIWVRTEEEEQTALRLVRERLGTSDDAPAA